MRIALLSDIHGNTVALDAVLNDLRTQGEIDAYWILGDLVAIGPDPVGVLEVITNLPNVQIIRGNTDRYVAEGERLRPTDKALDDDPSLRPIYDGIAISFAWTQGAITAAGWLKWLQDLPLDVRLVLPDGTRVLGVHASPGNDSGPGFHPGLSEAAMRSLLVDSEADLVIVGHTHWPMDFVLDDIRVFNLGSISNPVPPDLRATYAILSTDRRGYEIELRRVAYSHKDVIAAVQRIHHPAADYIVRVMRGQHEPAWR
jgi:predicted phosphodiesterase